MSSGSSHIVDNYIFDPVLQTVTFADYESIDLSGVKLITNVTAGIIIYQFNDVTKNGTAFSNILTFTYNTTTMGVDDTLMIIYEAPTDRSSDSYIIENLTSIDQTLKDTLSFNLNSIGSDEELLKQDNYENIERMSRTIVAATSLVPTSPGLIATPARLDKDLFFICALAGQVTKSEAIDCANFIHASFQVRAIVGSATASINPEISNDGQIWVGSMYTLPTTLGNPTTGGTVPSSGLMLNIPITARYLRISLSSSSAGYGILGKMALSSIAPVPSTFSGTVAVTGTVTSTVSGAKTNNAAVPAATNLGTLPAVANAASPVYTETFQTALSVDLSGAARTARVTLVPPTQVPDKSFPINQNTRGEQRVELDVLRRAAELQYLESMRASQELLNNGEQSSSGSYGFEIR